MKTQLTAEESAKLIELGVSPERASERTPDYTDINNTGRPLERRELLPIFTLTDILDILPKEIKRNTYSNYTFNILADNHYWNAEYRYWGGDHADDTLALFESEELIDALYSLLLWCLEKGGAMSKRQCEICGGYKEQHEMSKSYKHRCKECVARLTRIDRKAAKQRAENISQQLEGTGYTLACQREDRLRVATAAMLGILSNERTMQAYIDVAQNHPYPKLFEIVARNAMGYADALLTKIDEKGDSND